MHPVNGPILDHPDPLVHNLPFPGCFDATVHIVDAGGDTLNQRQSLP
jgi:hypothetical protein